MKTALITGATSGIGRATARVLAKNNYKIVLCGRREDRILELQKELLEFTEVHSLLFDVRDKKAVFDNLQNLPTEWQAINILVNNAGLALGRDSFENANLEDWETMIDTNVKGLLYASKAVLPMLIKEKGHIINIGSTAGKEVYKDGNVYCASKHAVDAISKAQRIDLLPYQIKVTAIHPGAADTEFSVVRFKGDAEKAKAVYNGYTPLMAEDIADTVWYVANTPAHVCINDLVITCTAQANSMYLQK